MSLNMEERPIAFNLLQKDELIYEITVRNAQPAKTVADMRAQIRALNRELPSDEICSSDLDPVADFAEVKAKFVVLENLVRGAAEAGCSLKLLNRVQAVAHHVFHRLSRISCGNNTDLQVEVDEIQERLNRILAKLDGLTRAFKSSLQASMEIDSNPRDDAVKEKVIVDRPAAVHTLNLKFNGKTCVKAFLQRLEELCLSRHVTDDKLFNSAAELFSDEALCWFRGVKDEVNDWTGLRRLLITEYLPFDYDHRLLKEIRERSQGVDESIVNYLSVMQDYFSRLSMPISDAEKLNIVLFNIRPFYTTQLALNPATSWADLKEKCRLLEAAKQRSELFAEPPKTSSSCLAPDLSYKGQRISKPSFPAPEFEDIFNATDDSIVCPQTGTSLSVSLDCLRANVFVPSLRTTLLPVLIFVHGGSFVSGSHTRYTYGPKFLVRHDVILVTLNYRLGVYGFMCTDSPRVPGNQAIKDLIIALKWVRDNIESFGGDPNRVTISGNSAGSILTDLIIASDKGAQHFQQAILQSGVSFLPRYSTSATPHFAIAEYLGFSTTDTDEALDFLATINPMEVISATGQLRLQLLPCIEKTFEGLDAFLSENWVAKERIIANDLKILLGFNENEALVLYLTPASDLSNIVEESLIGTFAIEHEEFTGQSEVRNFFFGDEEIDQSLLKEAIDLRSDNSFVHHTMRSVQRYQRSGVEEVYLYLFSYDGERNLLKRNLNTTVEGAVHADELGYLYDVVYLPEPNEEDQLMIDRMTEMWTNFVKYGNPTPQTSPLVPVTWQPITPNSPEHYLHIDSQLHTATSPHHERMAFWDLFLELNEHLQRLNVDSD